jgi:hypothetical protein
MSRAVVIEILSEEGKRRRSELIYSRNRASLAGILKMQNREYKPYLILGHQC